MSDAIDPPGLTADVRRRSHALVLWKDHYL
jgi:hypothetical protein